MRGHWKKQCHNADREDIGPVLVAEHGMKRKKRKKRKKRNNAYRITVQDFIKANRKASREEEIAYHGSQVSFRRVLHKSRRQYDRKRLPKVTVED